jgi:hypothetical protein
MKIKGIKACGIGNPITSGPMGAAGGWVPPDVSSVLSLTPRAQATLNPLGRI